MEGLMASLEWRASSFTTSTKDLGSVISRCSGNEPALLPRRGGTKTGLERAAEIAPIKDPLPTALCKSRFLFQLSFESISTYKSVIFSLSVSKYKIVTVGGTRQLSWGGVYYAVQGGSNF